MDQAIRNKLRGVVTQCRKLLEDSVRQELQGKFGIYAAKKDDVQVDDENRLNLTAEEGPSRKDILDHFAHIKARGFKANEALDQLVREIAFTHLNRLCAYKMMAARQVVVGEQRIYDVVGKGENSKLVQFFLADRPDEKKLFDKGEQAAAYRHCLDWLGGLLSEEIGVLFNPSDSANRLYPPHHFLAQVFDLINDETLADIWADDETIGWVYQYFTPVEDRAKARKASRSPRNSYELAFRNQFFTPRYVVEFLTDNTLGRTWYEMRKGDTRLKSQCKYMVRRPSEVFLAESQKQPKATENRDNLKQEELLKLPVYIPHRPKKDPREIKVLDPACGSGHFLLYCFDLLLTIYEEAYDDAGLGPKLKEEYPTLADLKKAAPALILANNLHGIDIDLRCTQIAALALWLRCQRAFQDMGLKKDRPKITRTNFVCAEPMPGEQPMLKEFLTQLESRLLGQLAEVVFDNMELAGEAGSLLKIEEEIRDAIAAARKQWVAETERATDRKGQPLLFSRADMERMSKKPQQGQLFDLSEITEDQFFEQAEVLLVDALRHYAEQAHNGQRLQRRLFAEDAVRGFAFLDLCRKRFDVVLMNPPFGESSKNSKTYIERAYENSYNDILAAFVERTLELCVANGFVGAITNRNCFYLTTMTNYRKEVLQRRVGLEALMDLGEGVLDATVEAATYVLRHVPRPQQVAPFVRLLTDEDKIQKAAAELAAINSGTSTSRAFYAAPANFALLESTPFCYWVRLDTLRTISDLPKLEGNGATIRVGLQTSKDFRFLRLIWEAPAASITPSPSIPRGVHKSLQTECLKELKAGKRWAFYSKTDEARPWLSPITLVVDWENEGQRIKEYARQQGNSPSRSVRSEDRYFQPGFSYMLRSTRLVPYVIPPGVIPTAGRSQVYPDADKEIEVLGICASRLGSAVARFGGEYFARPKFQNSMVQSIPAVPVSAKTRKELEHRFNTELALKRSVLSHFEPWHEFILPAILDNLQADDAWQLESLIGMDLEDRIATDAGLSKEDLTTLCRDLDDAISIRSRSATNEVVDEDDSEEEGEEEDDGSISLVDLSPRAQYEGLISYCLGVVFGRWDVRFAQNSKLIPKNQDVLDPLPVVPPGTLVSPDGYPATTGNIVSEAWLKARPNAVYLPATGSVAQPTVPDAKYPTPVQWDGVLVDSTDENGRSASPSDIERRIQDVLEIIFVKEAAAQEKAACEALGVGTLREYLRKPGNGGFWLDHMGRYTKSHRKAPIYWLLQSSQKNYALWVYYHRLDKETLLKALLPKGPVQTKINLAQSRLDDLRKKRKSAEGDAKTAKNLDKEIDKQEELLNEIKDFAEKLERAAKLEFGDKDKLNSSIQYTPDLNDGVVLNVAPLHELVPWKEAANYWKKILEGEYEWSSMSKLLQEKGLVK
jgi:hypothetical protein